MSFQPIASAVAVPQTEADRGPNGQFVAGNRASVGHNEWSRSVVANLRHALLAAVTPDDMRDVIQRLVREAKDGNVFAARELFNRTLGKCKPADETAGEDVQTFLEGLWRAWGMHAPREAEAEVEPAALPPAGS